MLIADIYDPPTPQGSAEENIVSNVKDFYDELRRIIFDTKVVISRLKTVKGQGKGTTGAWGLAESLNVAFKIALESCGWQPLQSPGAESPQSLIDWFKSKPSGRKYGADNVGLGLEIQFGNNYQFNEDIKRLSEANCVTDKSIDLGDLQILPLETRDVIYGRYADIEKLYDRRGKLALDDAVGFCIDRARDAYILGMHDVCSFLSGKSLEEVLSFEYERRGMSKNIPDLNCLIE